MIEVEVEVEDEAWLEALPEVEALVSRAVRAALDGEGEGAVTVLLADDEAIAELNARFRGRHSATNVLSFPAAQTAAPHLGDIALALGVCSAEAVAQSKPLAHHLQHLVAHGALHLVGFDHQSDDEAEVMEALERKYLAPVSKVNVHALDRSNHGLAE